MEESLSGEVAEVVVEGVGAVAVEGVEDRQMFSQIPALGVGLGFREPFRGELFLHQRKVDFLEITADHYLDAPPEKEKELELLEEHFTLIPHAINLSLGSSEGVDPDYLEKLAKLIERLDPPWWSEHISFSRAGGIDIGHLSPLPFSEEAVEVLCRNIKKVKCRISTPLILENISYLVDVPGGVISEDEFLVQVLEQTDCGMLLDVMNLHANSVNHGYDPYSFLERLPLERIVQLHFVGGHWHDNMLIDSHSHTTPEQVWQLMEEVISKAPVKGAILERDENLSSFTELLVEIQQARQIWERHQRWN